METKNTTQKLVIKLLNRKKCYNKATQYELVADELCITTRQVRYLESGEKQGSRALQKLIRILAQ
jgi:hypothetical protein